jgi:hypothetical protein
MTVPVIAGLYVGERMRRLESESRIEQLRSDVVGFMAENVELKARLDGHVPPSEVKRAKKATASIG